LLKNPVKKGDIGMNKGFFNTQYRYRGTIQENRISPKSVLQKNSDCYLIKWGGFVCQQECRS